MMGFFTLAIPFWLSLDYFCVIFSANVFNGYFDYRSGIDLRTKRTLSSEGSGILP